MGATSSMSVGSIGSMIGGGAGGSTGVGIPGSSGRVAGATSCINRGSSGSQMVVVV